MILYVIILVLIALCIYLAISRKKHNDIIDVKEKLQQTEIEHNKEVLQKQEELKEKATKLLDSLVQESELIKVKINSEQSKIESLKQARENMETIAHSSYENYCDSLDASYRETEEYYDNLTKEVESNYQIIITDLMTQQAEAKAELEKYVNTRAAAIEANRREKLVKEQKEQYTVQLPQADLIDIAKLESIKPTLSKPRVLSMLIWSTFWQKPLKSLSTKLLGTATVTGIYKITNQVTDKCYIGQSVDIAKRWAEHAKCGLGIDTPPGNLLYKAMQEYGLQNFSFELLETCSKEQLDEKERYFIGLYASDKVGYNLTKGNK